MNLRASTALATALTLCAPAASQAALTAYTQNFENLLISDTAALSGDGWIVYGNVYTLASVIIYGYGPFPAPNAGSAFCAIDAGQGGPTQGAQQLSVYSDYNNTDHANSRLIESNVYHEQSITAADVGQTWQFGFDAKLGNLASPSTALAFVKTIDPANGFATTNFINVNMTTIPTTWDRYTLSLPISAALVGQLAQFGFANTATMFQASGVFYDNITWDVQTTDAPGADRPSAIALSAPAPNPFTRSTRLEFTLAQAGPADISIFDVTGRRVTTLVRVELEPGIHTARWDGRYADGSLAPVGVYHCILQTAAGRQARNIVLAR